MDGQFQVTAPHWERSKLELRADSHLTSGQEQRQSEVPNAPKLPAGHLVLSCLFPLTLLKARLCLFLLL